MTSRLFAALFLIVPTLAAGAQAPASDTAAVLAVVNTLFDGMHAADSAKVRSTFAEGVRFAGADTSGGIEYMQVDRWLAAIARSAGRWEERIYDVQVRASDNMAQVWAPYTFYLDGKLLHCGIDAIELTRTTRGEWKITQLSDTRRQQGCPDPRPAR
jgi:hypothetical protein